MSTAREQLAHLGNRDFEIKHGFLWQGPDHWEQTADHLIEYRRLAERLLNATEEAHAALNKPCRCTYMQRKSGECHCDDENMEACSVLLKRALEGSGSPGGGDDAARHRTAR